MDGVDGERFRYARKAAGLSSERAAELLGVSRPYVSAIENDRRVNLTAQLIVKASELFGVSCSYLLGMRVRAASEITFHLHQKGILQPEDYKRQYESVKRLCERYDFNCTQFAEHLGLPLGPEV